MKRLGVKQGLKKLGGVNRMQGSRRAEEGVTEERMRGDTVAPIKIAVKETRMVRENRWGEVGERFKGLISEMDEGIEGGKGRRQVERRMLRFRMRRIMDMGIRVRVWRKETGESLVRRKWKGRVDGSHSEIRGSFLRVTDGAKSVELTLRT